MCDLEALLTSDSSVAVSSKFYSVPSIHTLCRLCAVVNVLDSVQVFEPDLALEPCLSEEYQLWQKQSSVQGKEQEERKGAKHHLNNESEAGTTGLKIYDSKQLEHGLLILCTIKH